MADTAHDDGWFSHRVLIAAGLVVLLLILVAAIWYAVVVLLLVFAGILVAIILRSLARGVTWLLRIPAPWSVLVVLAVLAVGLLAMGVLMAPRINREANQLVRDLPQSLTQISQRLEQQGWTRWLLDALRDADWQGGPTLFWQATGMIYTTVGAAVGLVLILFVGLYLAFSPKMYTDGLLLLFPASARPRVSELLGALYYTLRRWLVGQVLTMLAVGVMTGVGLWLLDVPLALTLGILAFALEFIPNFGPILAAVPALMLAWVDDPQKALYVLILYVVVQQLQSLLITPLVQRQTVWLPPALTITAQVLSGVLLGPLGLLLATPLTAVGVVTVKMIYVEDMLGSELDTPKDKLKPEDRPTLPEA